jgi:hypothetical protein
MEDTYLVIGFAIVVILMMISDYYTNAHKSCEDFHVTVNNNRGRHPHKHGHGYYDNYDNYDNYDGYYNYYNYYNSYGSYYNPFYYFTPRWWY